jgi:putative IMPACT (imprinted ancient) family translation regulator
MLSDRFTHPYELSAQVNHVMAAHEAEVVDAHYEGAVTLDVGVPATMAPIFETAMIEATAGAVDPRRIES